MRFDQPGRTLRVAAYGGLAFLHFPILFIFLYAFTTESKSYRFRRRVLPSTGLR